jgi:hypothetical protein
MPTWFASATTRPSSASTRRSSSKVQLWKSSTHASMNAAKPFDP